MCGILAVIGSQFPPPLIESKLRLMSHRGPDYSDSKQFDNIYLGHNRLAIIDLKPRSNQPFSIGEYTIIYNGEIYNYKELIKEHNLTVQTSSDTEVVLLMYKKYQNKCLQYFNGMFAFIIYNSKSKDIFIARDRLGIKPLYIKYESKRTIISSEIRPILELSPSNLDHFGVRQYKKLRMTVNCDTVYSDIKYFPAAHYSINGSVYRYWDLDISAKKPPRDNELLNLIENSVQIRKRSDVSLGSYLSGGLDSTILSYLLKPDFTYTVGFQEMNEFAWALKANQNLNSEHIQVTVTVPEYLEALDSMLDIRKEPLSVPNEVLIYIMTKRVKQNNTVILSGEGADELFYGYDRIFQWAYNSCNLDMDEFDRFYSYGSHNDSEVIDYALQGLPGESTLDKISYFFQIKHLHGLLRRLDSSTMLCSVEARVPFVDHRLIECVAGTPYSWRAVKRIKEPLKNIFSYLIPKEIIDRKKVGFPVPLDIIFNDKNKKYTPMDLFLRYNLERLNK